MNVRLDKRRKKSRSNPISLKVPAFFTPGLITYQKLMKRRHNVTTRDKSITKNSGKNALNPATQSCICKRMLSHLLKNRENKQKLR